MTAKSTGPHSSHGYDHGFDRPLSVPRPLADRLLNSILGQAEEIGRVRRLNSSLQHDLTEQRVTCRHLRGELATAQARLVDADHLLSELNARLRIAPG